MREILFRGKRTINGDWVYGDFVRGNERKSLRDSIFVYDSETQSFNDYEINPSTLGQYTGLKDKNGQQIWEGDILKFRDCGIYPVLWDADFFTFGSCWFSDFDPLYKYDRNKIEVIGNIHDNPELLEK